VLADAGVSIVLELTSLPLAKKREYVARALRSVGAERGRSGLPHWIVVDEAHYFFGAGPRRVPTQSSRRATSCS
jgi:hypothetical protein